MRPPYNSVRSRLNKHGVYLNTTGEAGQALKMAIDSARTQEDKVEAYFRAHPSGHAAGAARIHGTVFGWGPGAPPLTSTRRAITNLMKSDVLEKTSEKTDGIFGRPELKYRLRAQGQMRLL